MGVTTETDAQLAMSVIEITAVLFPLLLGLARYYVHQGDKLSDIPTAAIVEYTALLSSLLLLACIRTLNVFLEYGNDDIFASVGSFVLFFVVLLLFLPAVIADSFDKELVWAAVKGMFFAFLGLLILVVGMQIPIN